MSTYEKLRKQHPCLSRAKGETGRIHLPVSPSCNLSCRYCKRCVDRTSERPGVSRGILPVEEVPRILERALSLCPEITTVGIAGPGDTLATSHALDAFRLVSKTHPQLLKCMSTNGLLLDEKADEIAEVGVDTVTVTVNAVDPAIEAQINDRIYYHGEWIAGEEGARLLIQNQLQGIRRLSERGVLVKVNLVLIPQINGGHIEETARETAEAGARICNLIPLIPQEKMADSAAPDCEELSRAREEAGKYLDVFRHCQHCRADAVGRLGDTDLGGQLYGNLQVGETFSHG